MPPQAIDYEKLAREMGGKPVTSPSRCDAGDYGAAEHPGRRRLRRPRPRTRRLSADAVSAGPRPSHSRAVRISRSQAAGRGAGARRAQRPGKVGDGLRRGVLQLCPRSSRPSAMPRNANCLATSHPAAPLFEAARQTIAPTRRCRGRADRRADRRNFSSRRCAAERTAAAVAGRLAPYVPHGRARSAAARVLLPRARYSGHDGRRHSRSCKGRTRASRARLAAVAPRSSGRRRRARRRWAQGPQ